jgi:peptidoglycan DL-endopeptidase CwlO
MAAILPVRPRAPRGRRRPGRPCNLDVDRQAPCTILRMRPILTTGIAAAALLVAALTALAAAPAAPAATASLTSRQAQARELDRQVRELEHRYDGLQERYRGTQYELQRIQRQVAEAQRVVQATRRDLGVASQRLAGRADAIYRTGSSSELSELVGGGSFQDFFDRVDTRRRIGAQDATVLERVEALNRKVEQRERVLREARVRAAAATRRAQAAKDRMERILGERQARLESVNADIRQIMEAQRRAAEARAAARARASAAQARADAAAERPDGSTTSDAASSSSGSSSPSSTASIPLPPGSGTAARAASIAMTRLGSPYLWAASGPDRFDCSGLVTWAFAQAGRPGLPHSTYALINMGVEVPLDQLQAGDLVFSASIGHMGIYIGGGSFVHSPRSGDVVKVTSMSSYTIARARRI